MRRGAIGQERRAQPMPDATMADEDKRFTGTAVVFDSWTQIGSPDWGFRERVMPGSLDKTLRESDVVFLDGHEPLRPISRMSADTLRLIATNTGLAVDSDMDTGVSYVNDLARNVANRNVKGMSFGFRVTKDEWATGDDGVDERTIREVELIEVSATAFPAYTDTDASVRSAVLSAKCRRGSLTAQEIRAIRGMDPVAAPSAGTPEGDELVAAFEEAMHLRAEGKEEEALALLATVAAKTIDGASGAGESEPVDATRTRDLDEPADATRAVAQLERHMRGLAALHGMPKPA